MLAVIHLFNNSIVCFNLGSPVHRRVTLPLLHSVVFWDEPWGFEVRGRRCGHLGGAAELLRRPAPSPERRHLRSLVAGGGPTSGAKGNAGRGLRAAGALECQAEMGWGWLWNVGVLV